MRNKCFRRIFDMRVKFREVERNKEVERLRKIQEQERIANEGYRKIKPETDITMEEAKNFFNSLFEVR